jgi:AmmeMemoRadiSam system protein A
MNARTDTDQGAILPTIARAAIASRFGLWLDYPEDASLLHEQRACFVTLTLEGRLRGCIGSLQAHRKLLDDVRENAQAAAFHDPRFQPLGAHEYHATTIDVSVLSPLQPMTVRDEQDALTQLQPGIDGVVLQHGNKHGTFLPQVWASLPEPERFLGELKRKAGLSMDFWSEEVRLFRYHVDKWTEDR